MFWFQNGAQPLHCAANNGHLDIVKLLLAKGANPMARELQAEDMPLHWYAQSSVHVHTTMSWQLVGLLDCEQSAVFGPSKSSLHVF